jgi:hypothetical protein
MIALACVFVVPEYLLCADSNGDGPSGLEGCCTTHDDVLSYKVCNIPDYCEKPSHADYVCNVDTISCLNILLCRVKTSVRGVRAHIGP